MDPAATGVSSPDIKIAMINTVITMNMNPIIIHILLDAGCAAGTTGVVDAGEPMVVPDDPGVACAGLDNGLAGLYAEFAGGDGA